MTDAIVPSREQIDRFEQFLLQMPQVRIAVEQAVHGGIYARSAFIPAGLALTGDVHKFDHVNVMIGDVTFWTEQGMRRLTGFHVLPTKAGAKRVGMTHADTYWVTLIRTDLTDPQEIEAEVFENPHMLQTRRPELDAPVTAGAIT